MTGYVLEIGDEWLRQFGDQGFHTGRGALSGSDLEDARAEFDRLYESHPAGVDQRVLLTSPIFRRLLLDPAIMAVPRAVFGAQCQLLMYALRRGHGHFDHAPRKWHRDFEFVSDRLLSLNLILYLDDLPADDGATMVIPGSHREREFTHPPVAPVESEVAMPVNAGDVLFNWSTLVHSGSPCTSDRSRRLVLIYFGYWWLKRYEHDHQLPWQAYVDAGEDWLALVGLRMPGRDLHVDPTISGHPWL
jgi:hypothetical protein